MEGQKAKDRDEGTTRKEHGMGPWNWQATEDTTYKRRIGDPLLIPTLRSEQFCSFSVLPWHLGNLLGARVI